jgi:hypothetical protein
MPSESCDPSGFLIRKDPEKLGGEMAKKNNAAGNYTCDDGCGCEPRRIENCKDLLGDARKTT